MFKNLAIYRLTKEFVLNSDELEIVLKGKVFHPCGSHDEFSIGWDCPIGKDSLVYSSNGFMMLCLKREEKVLPAAVVNEMLAGKVEEIQDKEDRKLSKKERTALKDELIFELLPRAFSSSKKTFAYIDLKGGWIVVDAASTKKAEDLLSYLRKCLGSLPVVPINTVNSPVSVMTSWINDGLRVPKGIAIEYECEFRAPEEEGGIVRCKNLDLRMPEITNHVETGKQVIKLAFNWRDRLSFVLDENLGVKRLKFWDIVMDQGDIETETEADKFDVDFSILTGEISLFLPSLVEAFGGESK